MLGKLFSFASGSSGQCRHPLASADELRRALAALPADDDVRCLSEIGAWLQSLLSAGDFPPEQLLEVVYQFDEAGQTAMRRLSQHHALLAVDGHGGERERQLWQVAHACWDHLAALYGRIVQAVQQSSGVARRLQDRLPQLLVRNTVALRHLHAWSCRHYLTLGDAHWRDLARAVSMADHAGSGARSMNIYRQLAGVASVQQEFLRLLALHAASTGGLRPAEIIVAEHLIVQLGGHFALSSRPEPTSHYCFDLLNPAAPFRLADEREWQTAGLRFFRAGKAHAQLDQWLRQLERGTPLPRELALPEAISLTVQLAAVHHLLRQFMPQPEQRRHPRHPVDHRVSVVRGFVGAADLVFGAHLPAHDWAVENVGRGGMGLRIDHALVPSPQVGEFLLAQPEGGGNWLPGVVRRVVRRDQARIGLGVMTLGTALAGIELKVVNKSGQLTEEGCRGLLLSPAAADDEVLLALPLATFDVWQSLAGEVAGRRCRLHPLAVTLRGGDYEVARYRLGDLA